jgi:hypothetical protein
MCVFFKVFRVLLSAKYYVTVYGSTSFATSKPSPKEKFWIVLYQNAPPIRGVKFPEPLTKHHLKTLPSGADVAP